MPKNEQEEPGSKSGRKPGHKRTQKPLPPSLDSWADVAREVGTPLDAPSDESPGGDSGATAIGGSDSGAMARGGGGDSGAVVMGGGDSGAMARVGSDSGAMARSGGGDSGGALRSSYLSDTATEGSDSSRRVGLLRPTDNEDNLYVLLPDKPEPPSSRDLEAAVSASLSPPRASVAEATAPDDAEGNVAAAMSQAKAATEEEALRRSAAAKRFVREKKEEPEEEVLPDIPPPVPRRRVPPDEAASGERRPLRRTLVRVLVGAAILGAALALVFDLSRRGRDRGAADPAPAAGSAVAPETPAGPRKPEVASASPAEEAARLKIRRAFEWGVTAPSTTSAPAPLPPKGGGAPR